MNNKEIKALKNNKVVKDITPVAKQWARDYCNYYYIPSLCESFNGKYAYFYKDIFSERVIKITPDNYDKRLEILKESAKRLNLKYALFIGFYVPFYE